MHAFTLINNLTEVLCARTRAPGPRPDDNDNGEPRSPGAIGSRLLPGEPTIKLAKRSRSRLSLSLSFLFLSLSLSLRVSPREEREGLMRKRALRKVRYEKWPDGRRIQAAISGRDLISLDHERARVALRERWQRKKRGKGRRRRRGRADFHLFLS